MKRIGLHILFPLFLFPLFLFGQSYHSPGDSSRPQKKEHHPIGIGVMAGFNFSNVTSASEINAGGRTGYHFGVFYSPGSHSILGSRTELVYSRHGYNYGHDSSSASGNTPGSVDLDYIMLGQYMAINITKYFQIYLGGETSYLLHAKVDSNTAQIAAASPQAASVLSYYNRIQAGFGGGVEIHPYSGIVIGAHYTISLTNLYNTSSYTSGGSSSTPPSFIPGIGSINPKNNLIQVYAGWRF
jgi:Outer membrane protein beta-barrel domain